MSSCLMFGKCNRGWSDAYGISVNTLKSWEQGQRKPSGSAQVLLKLLGKKPELIDEIAHFA